MTWAWPSSSLHQADPTVPSLPASRCRVAPPPSRAARRAGVPSRAPSCRWTGRSRRGAFQSPSAESPRRSRCTRSPFALNRAGLPLSSAGTTAGAPRVLRDSNATWRASCATCRFNSATSRRCRMVALFVGSIWLRLSLRESLMISSLSTLPMFGISVLSNCGCPHSTKLGVTVAPAIGPSARRRGIRRACQRDASARIRAISSTPFAPQPRSSEGPSGRNCP